MNPRQMLLNEAAACSFTLLALLGLNIASSPMFVLWAFGIVPEQMVSACLFTVSRLSQHELED